MILKTQPLARTRGPVKDKGALMQTSAHLRFGCSLRAISPGPSPGRWRTPSMRGSASRWEALSALLLGSARSTAKRSTGAFPGSCLTPPRPTLAVGSPAVPRPGARVVAPRWRWSRLPGAGAERFPQDARASLGPALRHGRSISLTASRRATVSHPHMGHDRGHAGLPYRSVLRRGQGRPAAALPSPAPRRSRHAGPVARPVAPLDPAARKGCARLRHCGISLTPLRAGAASAACRLREVAWPATTSR